MSSIALLASTLSTFITIYTGLLFVRILLTWFPNISFYDQPFATLAQLTDPYLKGFEWDREECYTRFIVHQMKTGGQPAGESSKKKKKGGKAEETY